MTVTLNDIEQRELGVLIEKREWGAGLHRKHGPRPRYGTNRVSNDDHAADCDDAHRKQPCSCRTQSGHFDCCRRLSFQWNDDDILPSGPAQKPGAGQPRSITDSGVLRINHVVYGLRISTTLDFRRPRLPLVVNDW